VKDTRGMRVQAHRPRLTTKVSLPGEQDRLRQMVLYISLRCETAVRFGLIKLNKILWKADFDAYAARKVPVTGRAYQRLALGPAPKEMKPVLDDLARLGMIEFRQTAFGEGIVEQRPIAKVAPNLSNFSRGDLQFVDDAILYYWDKTGIETSDDSHGVAWKSRKDKATMYYELSYLSDHPITEDERTAIVRKLRTRGLVRGN